MEYMRKNYNLTNILRPYSRRKLWVALSEDNKKVLANGKTVDDVLGQVRKHNLKNTSIIQAIPDYSGFIPSA